MNNYDKLYLYSQNLSILIVEDYQPLRDDLVETFENFFEVVVSATDGVEGILAYESYHHKYNKYFDIVISDIEMPNSDGVDMSYKIREINPNQSIIILSAHSDSDYLLAFINLGVSKFISKPIDKMLLFQELLTLSKNITQDRANSDIIKLDSSHIWDNKKQTIFKYDTTIKLTKYEKIIFELFVSKPNSIFSNDDIVYAFYIYEIDIVESSIRNHILKLRKKLPVDMIETLYGMGYRLNTSTTLEVE